MFQKILHAQKVCYLLRLKRISISIMNVHVWSAECSFLKSNMFVSLVLSSGDLPFWRDLEIKSSWYWGLPLFRYPLCLTKSVEIQNLKRNENRCHQCWACCHIKKTLLSWKILCFNENGTIFLQRDKSRKLKGKLIYFLEKHLRQSQSIKSELMQKCLRSSHTWHDRFKFPLADEFGNIFMFHFTSYQSYLPSRSMILSISTDNSHWTPNFGPHSLTLSVKDVVLKQKGPQKFPAAAWSLLFQRRQNFSESHLSRNPIVPIIKKLWRWGRSTVRCRCTKMDISRYQMSNLEDI